MTNPSHPGTHPDPELLSSFAEGALPEHERLECVSHIADCARCREIVFLAQPPQPLPAVVPQTRTWVFQLRLVGGAVAACLVITAVLLYKHQFTRPALPAGSVQHVDSASLQAPVAPVAALPTGNNAAKTEPRASVKPRSRRNVAADRVEYQSATIRAQAPTPSILIGGSLTVPPAQPAPETSPAPQIPSAADSQHNIASRSEARPGYRSLFAMKTPHVNPADASSEIKGSVMDAAGTIIAGATVTVQANDGSAVHETKTDSSGQFSISGLQPGSYRLEVGSRGFATSTSEVDLKPNDVAVVAPTLNIGSVAETVEVIGAAATINAHQETMKSQKLTRPFASTVSNGTCILAVDVGGTLYLSRNQGRDWKAVKPKWKGKVLQVAVSEDQPSVFQITIDSNAVWASKDGTRWRLQKK